MSLFSPRLEGKVRPGRRRWAAGVGWGFHHGARRVGR